MNDNNNGNTNKELLMQPRSMLDETEGIQQLTEDTLQRIQWSLLESEITCNNTLETLHQQRHQMKTVQMEAEDVVDIKLAKTKKLMKKFGTWRGHWLGRNKVAARKEATKQIKIQERGREKNTIGEQRKTWIASNKNIFDDAKDSLTELTTDDSCFQADSGEVGEGSIDDVMARHDFPDEEAEFKARLNAIDKQDKEIDGALDEMLAVVRRLGGKTKEMTGEISHIDENLSRTEEAVNRANSDQAYLNAWMKRIIK